MKKEIIVADITDFKWSIEKFLEEAKKHPDATHFSIERFKENNYNHSLVLMKYEESK